MALRNIVLIGEPVLRKKARKVDRVTPLLEQLMEDMAETMYAAPGIGLAAPQVGVSKRIIVVDVGEENGGLHKLINPKVIFSEGSEIDTEACLSVPGKVGDVERAAKVVVKAMTPEGKYIKIEAEGLFARCLQHEIDHLEGILYVDKAEDIREPEYPEEEYEHEEGAITPEDIEKHKQEEKQKISIPITPQPKAIFEVGGE